MVKDFFRNFLLVVLITFLGYYGYQVLYGGAGWQDFYVELKRFGQIFPTIFLVPDLIVALLITLL